MQLQLDIYKGVPKGNGQHKIQEEYEALAQGHGGPRKKHSYGLEVPQQTVWSLQFYYGEKLPMAWGYHNR